MSDLIDRRSVVNWLENYKFENYASVGHEREYNFIENLIKGIQNEPTVEAIPKAKLDEIVEKLENEARFYNSASDTDQNIRSGVKMAIEIVKGVMNERD